MSPRILFFTQPGCMSCELMRVFLEAQQVAFEERDIVADSDARRAMLEKYGSNETPTVVVFSGGSEEVVIGFDPALLDRLLQAAPSSDSMMES